MGKYHVHKSPSKQYYWNLRAGNGERILQSEMYTSKGAAFGGINSCKENSGSADRYEKRTSNDGKPYFILRAKNNEVIGVSETYSSTQARDAGIASCMANGPTSGTQDDTGE